MHRKYHTIAVLQCIIGSQAGFRKERLTVDQVTRLTQDIEDCFEAKETVGTVLVDLTAAYDTV